MQGAGSPLGPTRVPSAKGESNASATIVGRHRRCGAGHRGHCRCGRRPVGPAGRSAAADPSDADRRGRGRQWPTKRRARAAIPRPSRCRLVCHAQAALESQLGRGPLGIAVRGLTASEIAAAELANRRGAIVTSHRARVAAHDRRWRCNVGGTSVDRPATTRRVAGAGRRARGDWCRAARRPGSR